MIKIRKVCAVLLTLIMILHVSLCGSPVLAAENNDSPLGLEVSKTDNKVTLRFVANEGIEGFAGFETVKGSLSYNNDIFTYINRSIGSEVPDDNTDPENPEEFDISFSGGKIMGFHGNGVDLAAGTALFFMSFTVSDSYVKGENYVFSLKLDGVWDGEGIYYSWASDPEIYSVTLHEHAYGEPEWKWADDYSSATASFACVGEDDTQIVTDDDIAETEVTPATCTGNKVVKYTAEVTFEGETYSNTKDNVEVADTALGHDYEISYVWAEDGSSCAATATCKRDASHVVTENGTITSEVTTAATCEGKGTTTYTATFTKEPFTTQTKDVEDVDPIGHDYEISYVWAEDGSSCAATATCKRDASHVVTENGAITSEVTTAATCEGKGTTTYTATFTKEPFTTQTKDVEDINALGHNWGTPSYVWDKTAEPWKCTATRVCSRDQSHTETETATAELVVITPATTMQEGSGEWIAEFKNKAFEKQTETVTIPKIPGWYIKLQNYAPNTATTSLDPELLYANGEVTFTVSNIVNMAVFDEPVDAGCVLAVKNSDGSYTPLQCTTVDGTHSFTVTMNSADIELVLVMRGDANLNGKVDGPDLTLTKKVVMETEGYDPGPIRLLAMDASIDGRIKGNDLTLIKGMTLGSQVLGW